MKSTFLAWLNPDYLVGKSTSTGVAGDAASATSPGDHLCHQRHRVTWRPKMNRSFFALRNGILQGYSAYSGI